VTRTVTLRSLVGAPLRLEGVRAPPEVTVLPQNPQGTILTLRVAFSPRDRPGWRDGQIKLRFQGVRRREVALPFKAMVNGVVDTDPSFLNFGTVMPGQTKILPMRLVRRTTQPVRLRLMAKPSFLAVAPVSGDQSQWRVRLTVPSGSRPQQVLGGKIVFRTNLALQPTLEVPFFAAIEGRPSPKVGARGKLERRRDF